MEKTEAENSQTEFEWDKNVCGHKLGREMATFGSRAVFLDSVIVYFLQLLLCYKGLLFNK